jgi:hypothetical protein
MSPDSVDVGAARRRLGAGSLWLARPRSSAIDRIDPNTGSVITHLRVRTRGPLAFSGRSVWTASANGVVKRVATP